MFIRNGRLIGTCCVRRFASITARKSFIVGAFQAEPTTATDVPSLTKAATEVNKRTKGVLLEQLNCGKPLKTGECRLLYGLDKDHSLVAVVGLGKRGASIDPAENWHEGLENVRKAVAAGSGALRKAGATTISVDSCGYANAAAEGANLSLFTYDELKDVEKRENKVSLELFQTEESTASEEGLWKEGTVMAESQNLARTLMEMPANLLNPTTFAQKAQNLLTEATVHARDQTWAEEKGMLSFLSVNKGSCGPPVFLEIHLEPSLAVSGPPVVLVGKGVCFDSGGISLKPSNKMDLMRGDMGGAATVFSAAYGLQKLEKITRKLVILIPLVENMPNDKATRPGDIIRSMSGKTIKIDNTDAEGRLILADALTYADSFKPEHVVDVATLTGAIHIALGGAASGVFSNNDSLWEALYKASVETGDRMWRLPLFKHYSKKLETPYADLNNIALPNSGAGSCTAAAFLKEFTKCKSWAHIDMAGVMDGDKEIPYVSTGMSGRPTRVLMKWLMSL